MQPKFSTSEAANILHLTLPALHKRIKSKGLDYSQYGRKAYFNHTTAKQVFNIDFKQKNISFHVVKGGCGKSTICWCFGIRANLYGAKVLFVDVDQQANLTDALNVNPSDRPCLIDFVQKRKSIKELIYNVSDGIDLISSKMDNALLDKEMMFKSLPLDRIFKNPFDELRNDYDLILFDNPPSLSLTVKSIALASDIVVSPVTPESFALSGLFLTSAELEENAYDYNKVFNHKIVINKYDNRTSLSQMMLGEIARHEKFGTKLCDTYIRSSQEFSNAAANGGTIYDTLKSTSAKEDIDTFTREILEIRTTKENKIVLGSLSSSDKNSDTKLAANA